MLMKTFFKMLLAFIFQIVVSYSCFVLHEIIKMDWILIIGMIMGYTAIHFILMFITAPILFALFRMKYNYLHRWFAPKRFEEKLYQILKVKKWKNKIPTYDNAAYSLTKQNITKAIQMTCHAEIVHEVISVLSYLPILLGLVIPKVGLFVVLSFAFSVTHLLFSIVQRYNRPRLLGFYEKQKSRS